MALPATDNFSTNADQNLEARSGWSRALGSMWIDENDDCVVQDQAGATESAFYWDADSFSNDQYSEAVLTGTGGYGSWFGVGVRIENTETNPDYYVFYVGGGSDDWYLAKNEVGGDGWTNMDSGTQAISPPDTFYLEVDGTTLTAKYNGAQLAQETDADIASGSAGLTGSGNDGSNELDDFEGGDLAGDAPVYGTATIAQGSCSLGALGSVDAFGKSSLAETSSLLSATGKSSPVGSASLTQGSYDLTADGKTGALGAASLSGSGALTGAGATGILGSSTLAATPGLSATAAAGKLASAVLAEGSSVLAGVGSVMQYGKATLSETSSLLEAAGGIDDPNRYGTATLTGASSTLGALGESSPAGSAILTQGSYGLSALGRTDILGSASLTGDGALTGAGAAGQLAAATLEEGSSALTGSGASLQYGKAALSQSSSTLSASGSLDSEVWGSVSFTGAGDLSVAGSAQILASAVLTEGFYSLGADGICSPIGTVTLTAVPALSASAYCTKYAAATLEELVSLLSASGKAKSEGGGSVSAKYKPHKKVVRFKRNHGSLWGSL